jgi:hypothetical protein
VLPIGTRVMLSTPAAITTSCTPDITACAANWIACCDDPHCRSIVTAGVDSGSNLAASTALRPTCPACCPPWLTHPMITSSIAMGSIPVRCTSASSVSAARSTGCTPASRPLRRPPAVRTASTI